MNSRSQTAEGAGLRGEDVPKLQLKWAFGFPNGSSAYGQPAVAGGRLFVGSDNGFVYSLDAATGCVYWSFEAKGGVRTAINLGQINTAAGTRHVAYFGDLRANVFAIDAETGAVIWTHRVDAHPFARITGAPTLANGRLYVPVSSLEEGSGANDNYECCTFRGSVAAYDATSGKQLWQTFMVDAPKPTRKNKTGTQLYEPSGVAIWSAPTIDVKRNVLYVATGNEYSGPGGPTSDAVIAVNLDDGRIAWTSQVTPKDVYVVGCNAQRENCPEDEGPDFDFGNSAILRDLPDGKSIIVIGQKSGVVWALDPDNKGALVWQRRVGKGSALGGLEWGSAADTTVGYFPVSDIMLGQELAGGLHALRLDTGAPVWEARPPRADCKDPKNCVQAQSAAITLIPGAVFSGTTNGIMRAYDPKDGRVIWTYDANQPYTTVNGVAGERRFVQRPGPGGGRRDDVHECRLQLPRLRAPPATCCWRLHRNNRLVGRLQAKPQAQPASPKQVISLRMEISRERFLDESRSYHLTIGLRSRTTEAHSLLTALTADEREQVSKAIVKAMDQIENIVRSHLSPPK